MSEILTADEVNKLPVGSVVRSKGGVVVTVVEGMMPFRWVDPFGFTSSYERVFHDNGWQLLHRGKPNVKVGDLVDAKTADTLPPMSVVRVEVDDHYLDRTIIVITKGLPSAKGDTHWTYDDGSAGYNLSLVLDFGSDCRFKLRVLHIEDDEE